jgi:hypothetical protein
MEGEGESQMRDVAVQMIQAMKDTPAGAAAKWAGIIASLCAHTGGAIMAASEGAAKPAKITWDRPDWCRDSIDQRAAPHWDTSQTVANVAINGQHTLAIVDTGSYKSILDIGMAKMLKLPIREAVGGDCGTYSTPGTNSSNCYAGVVEGPCEIRLSDQVRYRVQGLKLIWHPHPIALLGADLLSGGRPAGEVNFTGVKLATDAQGRVRGSICFEKGGATIEEPLVNVPTARGSHSAGTATLGMIAGPPLGGQYVRRGSQ